MKLMPLGDYYVWYCDWCDSRNHTLWTRIDQGKVVCGVCYTPFAIFPPALGEQGCGTVKHLPRSSASEILKGFP